MRQLVLLLLFMSVIGANAQEKQHYTPGFDFVEGVYLNFEQFSSNDPIGKDRLISSYSKDRSDFIKHELDKNRFVYLDTSGKKVEHDPDKIWGYCSNNTIYKLTVGGFTRISVIGSLCHYTSSVPVIGLTDPFSPNNYNGDELVQFVLEMSTGRVYDFTVKNMQVLLNKDNELGQQFSKEKGKKKKLFLYLRKFNERNRLYFGKDE